MGKSNLVASLKRRFTAWSDELLNVQKQIKKYFEIQFELLKMDLKAAKYFASQCRKQELDRLLILQPGSDRGVAY